MAKKKYIYFYPFLRSELKKAQADHPIKIFHPQLNHRTRPQKKSFRQKNRPEKNEGPIHFDFLTYLKNIAFTFSNQRNY